MSEIMRWGIYEARRIKYRIYEKASSFMTKQKTTRSVLAVMPADPLKVIGSTGDEALLVGAFDWLRAHDIDSPISLIVAEEMNIPRFDGYNLSGIKAWSRSGFKGYQELAKIFSKANRFLVFGADVMDGHYSVSHVQRVVSYARLAAAQGIATSIMGFSFNKNPSQEAIWALRELPPDTIINIRDPLSFARFTKLVGRQARLVADVGFLLKPRHDNETVSQLGAWVDEQRNLDRSLLGLNLHPMLLPLESRTSLSQLVAAGIAVVERALQENCSIVLIPHDSRGLDGDAQVLQPILAALSEKQRTHVHFIDHSIGAREVKAICGFLDVVLTGRMHLAIAALGMGIPVGCVTYQDKFEGLMAHFQLDNSLLLPAEEFVDVNKARGHFMYVFSTRKQSAEIIRAQIQRIVALAEQNLYELLPKQGEN